MAKRARIPKIRPDNNNGSIRLRWQYQGRQYRLSGFGAWDDPTAQSIAIATGEQIKRDIRLGIFDPSLESYQSHHKRNQKAIDEYQRAISTHEQGTQWTLLDVWNFYKSHNVESTPRTTQKNHWRATDNAIALLCTEETLPDNVHKVTPKLLAHYSPSTLQRVLASLVAASNLAFNYGHIPKSYWKDIKKQLPKKASRDESKRTNKAYTVEEVKAILEAFRTDRYCPTKSAYLHSHYYHFVEFLLLTGCRPGEACALTWDDIGEGRIKISKSYSLNELKPTKNGKTRYFPTNEQLKECLAMQHRNPRSYNSLNLVFPSFKSGYINLHNFTTKIFSRVINGLFNDGIIRQKLPTYSLRNTSASFYLRRGVDRATIAKLFETSGEMLDNHYFSPDDDIQLPDI
ncbi:MAG: tyrosine-type recombinase/integrase [Roseofilum sp. SBFL]|uniref:tyrosine-type recombinase/integrase n=1 Tax=unclassified Roseofilum TaxID=2620099 RepID=UPI001B018CD3|nr:MULTISPECIES: tyrosine-type recombinase/integrase [unclassified Roseofilum]MBP0014677.1 tyrosine-type recombinase/integrase [Roseofilum sp. SID3]MBP0024956.1 tyrosine-type recombinase/integrase [Roseofilum sp. SID2]MBP0039675.1 tyrosine-type recombinase/integrase [Roseofilum sp. SID1]MBP0042544.1 tyrosine-type recombinase/integrase [Roseofilum sp. SBFL]